MRGRFSGVCDYPEHGFKSFYSRSALLRAGLRRKEISFGWIFTARLRRPSVAKLPLA
jgi:hypothetical protein